MEHINIATPRRLRITDVDYLIEYIKGIPQPVTTENIVDCWTVVRYYQAYNRHVSICSNDECICEPHRKWTQYDKISDIYSDDQLINEIIARVRDVLQLDELNQLIRGWHTSNVNAS